MKKLLATLASTLLTAGLLAAQTTAPPAPGDPPQPPDSPQAMARHGSGMFVGRGMGMMGGQRMGMRGPEPGMWWLNPGLAKRLGLTDDEVAKIKKTFQDHRLELIDLHANLEKQEVILEPMINADHPDENAVLAQIDKVAEARANLEKSNARMLFAIRDTLTPEQWQKLRAMHSEMRHPRPMSGHGFRGREGRPGRMMMRRDGRNSGGPQAAPPPANSPAPPSDGGSPQP